MMGELNAVLLGSPEVYWNGRKLVFPFAKSEALLYYLLVKKSASREELAALLWGDMEDAAAKKNLRNTIYLLKKLIADDFLLTPSRANVLLNSQAIAASTDLQEFFAAGLEESLVLYRGEFLAGFACKDAELFETWLSGEREQIREELVSRFTKIIVGKMNNKDYASAKRYLKRLIALDELNESAYRALMKIYEREGAFNKAIDVYSALAAKVSAELGLEPDDKTKEVYNRIRARKFVKPDRPKEFGGEIFFGRERELALLTNMYENFCAGRQPRSLVLVCGEQGVGKTAIVQQLTERVGSGSVLLRTQCYQAEQEYPYKAWNQILGQALGLLGERGVVLPAMWQQVISYVFPALVNTTVSAPQHGLINAYDIHAGMVEEIMGAILGQAAGQGKLLLIVEDIQWLDTSGWTALKFIIRVLGRQVLCIATCRSEYQEACGRFTGEFEKAGLLEYIVLENFSREEVVRFSTQVLPPDKIHAELQQKLYEYTEGNALFLVECFKLIQLGQELGLSARLRGVLQERFNAVSDNARKVLEVISVFFSDISYDEIFAVCGMDEFGIVEAIEEIQQKHLIQEVDSAALGRRGPIYKYSHTRIREYVYSQLSSLRQRMLHRKAGTYLEGLLERDFRGQDLYSEILYHYSQIEEKVKVLEYTVKIAERYSCPQYELFPDLSEILRGGNACVFDDGAQILRQLDNIRELLVALEHSTVDKRGISRFRVAYLEMLGRYYIWQGNHREGLKAIHQMLRLSAKWNFDDYLIKGYQQVVYCGIQIRHPRLIEWFAGKLLKKADEENLAEKTAIVSRFLGIAHALRREQELAEQCYRQSLSVFKRLGEENSNYSLHMAAAYNYIGELRRTDGNLAEALYYYEQAIRITGKHTVSAGFSIFLINAGFAAYELGEYGKSYQYLEDALGLGQRFGDQRGYWCLRCYSTLHSLLALLAIRDKRPEAGRQHLKTADSILQRHYDAYQAGVILRTKLQLAIWMQQDGKLRQAFRDYLPLPVEEYYRRGKEIFLHLDSVLDQRLLDEVYAGYKGS
ncbi:hypothetical protein SPSPH_003060 [Sporomusa sphaeroides DSM 2875]|uniref:Bacterial transcriptional activator domain protein n=2 Tax=Sporomusa TaxID=2375 RepID=A0ABM9W0R3_9FIRM|nr:bacterial transcriptional activator domain protein [Sporomusa sphaeroides DSM 2875]CVK18733.1 Bacterial transcriptional activator domain protein [Sporomusa sphaeroides DSM 2875]